MVIKPNQFDRQNLNDIVLPYLYHRSLINIYYMNTLKSILLAAAIAAPGCKPSNNPAPVLTEDIIREEACQIAENISSQALSIIQTGHRTNQKGPTIIFETEKTVANPEHIHQGALTGSYLEVGKTTGGREVHGGTEEAVSISHISTISGLNYYYRAGDIYSFTGDRRNTITQFIDRLGEGELPQMTHYVSAEETYTNGYSRCYISLSAAGKPALIKQEYPQQVCIDLFVMGGNHLFKVKKAANSTAKDK